MDFMLPQCYQSPSMKREAETQCFQCWDVTPHRFMGCLSSSQGHTEPISQSVHFHPHSHMYCLDHQCLPSMVFQIQGFQKASLGLAGPRASQSLECVAHVYV